MNTNASLRQVLGKAFEIVTHLVNMSTVTKKDAFTAMGGLVEKMSDIKLKGPAAEALFAISEALGPQFTITQLHKKAAAHKNPKVRSSIQEERTSPLGTVSLHLHLLPESIHLPPPPPKAA